MRMPPFKLHGHCASTLFKINQGNEKSNFSLVMLKKGGSRQGLNASRLLVGSQNLSTISKDQISQVILK